jgi:CubicO group peptidase (beta-lactamase class C family)
MRFVTLFRAGIVVALLPITWAHAQSGSASDAEAMKGKLEKVRTVVKQHIDAGDTPGAITLVAHNGSIVFQDAQGTTGGEQALNLNTNTVFWVASMTKPIVATSILALMDEGKLGLDDPVSKFIPEFKSPGTVRVLRAGSPPPSAAPDAPKAVYDLVPAERPLTIRHLITQTSGLQTIGVPNDALPVRDENSTLANWVPQLGTVPRDFQAGTRWAYSNSTAFDVLARIVEVVSGTPFDRFVQQRILDPLGMTASSFGPNPALVSRTMTIAPNLAADPCIQGRNFKCGSAGMWTSAEDYSRFAQMLLDGGRGNGRTILSTKAVELMRTNQTGNLYAAGQQTFKAGVGFGLSLAVVENPQSAGLSLPAGSFGHDGVGSRRFWVIPGKNAVLVMFLPGGKAPPVHRDIERAVMDALP